ncbi:hypothetical protein OH687_18695 [Burkholderia anthina]|nr:hypothetical protein OH687_18695 [Burkholderia anthina]
MTRLLDAAFGMATTTAIQLAAASVPSWPIADVPPRKFG